jgi:hypothetical protein
MKTNILGSSGLQQYQEDGYLIVRSLLSPEEAQLLYETSTGDSVLRENSYDVIDRQGNKSRLALWFTPGDDVYGMLSRSEPLVEAVEGLLGGPVGHFHSKVMQKEPRVGGAWEWHQDYGYWYKNGFLFTDMLSVMFALTPATQENGCLQVIKGSHKMGRLEHGFAGEQVGADMERVDEIMKIREKVYCELQPGDALFFHCNLLHASAPNTSDKSRWSIISAYNLLANKPFKEKTTSCITPIEKVPGNSLLQAGRRGLGVTSDLLRKEEDISLK